MKETNYLSKFHHRGSSLLKATPVPKKSYDRQVKAIELFFRVQCRYLGLRTPYLSNLF